MSWDGQERRQAQLEIRELLREEMKDTVQPLIERIDNLEKVSAEWKTSLKVLTWATKATIAVAGALAVTADWYKEHVR